MKPRRLHRWNLSPREAVQVQRRLSDRVETDDRLPPLGLVAGVDVGLPRGAKVARAAVAVLSWPALELVDRAVVDREIDFPYVPGLLSFREIPVALEALGRLRRPPDLVLCDGHGLAHPRRFGLACHLGLIAGLPTIGVAKSRLVGEYPEVGPERGDRVPLIDRGERIGTVLRTRARVKPVFVSIGHRVSLDTAVRLVLDAAPRYRLPETTRWAHRLASAGRRRAARG